MAVLAVALCVIGIAFLGLDVARRIQDQATASDDSAQWSLNQTDVELLALELAVSKAISADQLAPPGGLQDTTLLGEVRKRFDVFFSRVTTLKKSTVFAPMRNQPEFAANSEALAAFLDDCTPIVDGPDAGLLAALPDMASKIAELRPKTRQMTLAGLHAYAEQALRNRRGVEHTLTLVAVLTSVFILMLLSMVVLLLQLDAQNKARTAEAAGTAQRLSAIIATAQDAVVTIDPLGRIVDFNAAARAIFGQAPRDAIGAPMRSLLFAAPDRHVLDEAVAALAHRPAGGPQGEAQGETRLRLHALHRSGRSFPAEVSISVAEGGGLVVAFLRDLTAQVASEQALVDARDTALAGERAKAELLAVMSHEIRTPLNGMLGTLELLESTRLSPRQAQLLQVMEDSGKLLLGHVNDVLDISRLDSGLTAASALQVDLGALARDVVANQSAAAMAEGNTLVLNLPTDGRLTILSDERLLKQVLLNLLGNAVKFTRSGQITLSIRHLGPDGPTLFSVTDTGEGISKDDQARVFDDFVTLDPSYARQKGGTGLGLGICRRIVAQLGGQLSVDSELGEGSTFRFAITVPILSAEASSPMFRHGGMRPAGAAETGPCDKSLAVLIVEDNDINRFVLGEMLRRDGHRAFEAASGAEGLRMAQAEAYDLIMTDVAMPGLDGLQVTSAIRTQPGPCRDVPIIAVTAHAMDDEVLRFHAGGVTEVLTKPISQERLRQVIDQAMTAAPLAVVAMTETAPPKPRGRRAVRLIDDKVMQEFRLALTPETMDKLLVSFLAEGEAALKIVTAEAAAGHQSDKMRAVVHRLAGSAGMIGAAALRDVLATIETHLKTGATSEALAMLPHFAKLWDETSRACQEMMSVDRAGSA